MPRVVWLTVPEYADYVDMSPQYIRKIIKNGKITKKSLKRKGVRSFLINPKKADSDLLANTSHVNKKSVKYNGKKIKRQPKKETKKKPISEDDKKNIIKFAGLKIVSLTEAQKLKENYLAALRKLEYKTKRRELLSYDEVRKSFADMVLSARSKILSIKGLLAPLLKEFVDDPENFRAVMENIEIVIRDVLTEMAESDIKR